MQKTRETFLTVELGRALSESIFQLLKNVLVFNIVRVRLPSASRSWWRSAFSSSSLSSWAGGTRKRPRRHFFYFSILLQLNFELACFTSMEYPKSETAELVWNLFKNILENTLSSKEKRNKRDFPREKSRNQCFPRILADFVNFFANLSVFSQKSL